MKAAYRNPKSHRRRELHLPIIMLRPEAEGGGRRGLSSGARAPRRAQRGPYEDKKKKTKKKEKRIKMKKKKKKEKEEEKGKKKI